MSEASETKPSVWTSLKRILDMLLATPLNRVELFAVEFQEEKVPAAGGHALLQWPHSA